MASEKILSAVQEAIDKFESMSDDDLWNLFKDHKDDELTKLLNADLVELEITSIYNYVSKSNRTAFIIQVGM